MLSPISTKVGDLMLNAFLSNGRHHTQSTRLMTTRDASVIIGVVEKRLVPKQPAMTMTRVKKMMTMETKAKMTVLTMTIKMTVKIPIAKLTFLKSLILHRNSRQSGQILTTRKTHHRGPCSKSIAPLTISKRNFLRSMPYSRLDNFLTEIPTLKKEITNQNTLYLPCQFKSKLE